MIVLVAVVRSTTAVLVLVCKNPHEGNQPSFLLETKGREAKERPDTAERGTQHTRKCRMIHSSTSQAALVSAALGTTGYHTCISRALVVLVGLSS